jgi:hypothetical protein
MSKGGIVHDEPVPWEINPVMSLCLWEIKEPNPTYLRFFQPGKSEASSFARNLPTISGEMPTTVTLHAPFIWSVPSSSGFNLDRTELKDRGSWLTLESNDSWGVGRLLTSLRVIWFTARCGDNMALRPCTSDDGNFLGESNEERGVRRPILKQLALTLVPLFPLVMWCNGGIV